jgi:hypothetical protein
MISACQTSTPAPASLPTNQSTSAGTESVTFTTAPALTAEPTLVPSTPTLTPIPSPTNTKAPPSPTASVAESTATEISLPSEDLSLTNANSILAWLQHALLKPDVEVLSSFVGANGTVFAPYGIGVVPPGENNLDEVISNFQIILVNNSPICIGYKPENLDEGTSGSRLTIVFNHLSLAEIGLSSDTEYAKFVFLSDKAGEPYELAIVAPIDNYGLEYEFDGLVPCSKPIKNEQIDVSPTPMEKPVLDRTDPYSVIQNLVYAFNIGDSSFFEIMLADSINYGPGIAGGRSLISKQQFIEMLSERIIHSPVCLGYTDDVGMVIWTGNWDPDWENLDTAGSDELVMFLSLESGKFVIHTAYFVPSSGVMEVVGAKDCP